MHLTRREIEAAFQNPETTILDAADWEENRLIAQSDPASQRVCATSPCLFSGDMFGIISQAGSLLVSLQYPEQKSLLHSLRSMNFVAPAASFVSLEVVVSETRVLERCHYLYFSARQGGVEVAKGEMIFTLKHKD